MNVQLMVRLKGLTYIGVNRNYPDGYYLHPQVNVLTRRYHSHPQVNVLTKTKPEVKKILT